MKRWAILTGEYPPQPGGVSDYTRQVARGLARAGQTVRVFAPACDDACEASDGVQVHRIPGGFGMRGLRLLDNELVPFDSAGPLLVQFVPHAFGWKGMNLHLCRWLRARKEQVWVMFHEVAFPLLPGQPLKHRLLATVQRLMAAMIARRADRIFVSTPAWDPILKDLYGGAITQWLPIPSNLPDHADPARVCSLREAFPGMRLLGHFGTYGEAIRGSLEVVLPAVLGADPDVIALLLGQGGDRFAGYLAARHPNLAGRIKAPGVLLPEAAAAHLAACDLVVQPYPDGATTRRGSLMASLALGLPVLTTSGVLTEPLWSESGAVALAPCGENCARDLSAACRRLLADPALRRDLAHRGQVLYRQRFAIERTLEILLAS